MLLPVSVCIFLAFPSLAANRIFMGLFSSRIEPPRGAASHAHRLTVCTPTHTYPDNLRNTVGRQGLLLHDTHVNTSHTSAVRHTHEGALRDNHLCGFSMVLATAA